MSEADDGVRQENPVFFDRVEELERSVRPSIEDEFRRGGVAYLKDTLEMLNREAHAMHKGLLGQELSVVCETGRLLGCHVLALKGIMTGLQALNVSDIEGRDVRGRPNLFFIEHAIPFIGNAKAILAAKKEGLCPILLETKQ